MAHRLLAGVAALSLVILGFAPLGAARQTRAVPPPRLRLYVLDCGYINVSREGTERYKVTPEEVAETRFSVVCHLIVHPKGTLIWDMGLVPDPTIEARARGLQIESPSPTVAIATRTLASQLAALGYTPDDITFAAVSHAHGDHIANANLFANATWLMRPAEWAFMWEPGNTRVTPANYSKIATAPRVMLEADEHDVFGDGSAILKLAAGHSPGHQVLVLNLEKTGRVMLAGDLYHYPEERSLKRPPPDTEANVQRSAAARVLIEEYLARTKAALWIEHDFLANAKLRKSPRFYD